MAPDKVAMDRFWQKVDKSADCWIWTGAKQGRGYGSFFFEGKNYQAHRWIFAATFDDEIAGKDICHVCDNPACVNPSHLFVGDRAENMQDCARKGRNIIQRKPSLNHFFRDKYPPAGEKHGNSKLTEDVVAEIRKLSEAGESSSAISRTVGISAGHVRKIASGVAWKHSASVTKETNHD